MSEVDYSKETPLKYMKMNIIYSIIIIVLTALLQNIIINMILLKL